MINKKKKIPDIRANSHNGRKLLNRASSKEVLLKKKHARYLREEESILVSVFKCPEYPDSDKV